MTFSSLIDTGANCSLIKESIANKLGCHLLPVSTYINALGQNNKHVFAIISVIVQFEGVCLELDINVVGDNILRYDLLIGRNAVNYPDIEIITDSSGCRLSRKLCEISPEVNLVSSLFESSELTSKIEHLSVDLQEKIV